MNKNTRLHYCMDTGTGASNPLLTLIGVETGLEAPSQCPCNSEALCFCSSQSQNLKVKCSGVPSSLAPSAARGARAARVIALQLAPPSPIAARAERADAPAPAAARAPMMISLGPLFFR